MKIIFFVSIFLIGQLLNPGISLCKAEKDNTFKTKLEENSSSISFSTTSDSCDFCSNSDQFCSNCSNSCVDFESCDLCNSSDCFHIVAANSDYLTNKLETDANFKDLFDYANELGFTQCIGKWLVYEKRNGHLIGFMGLRIDETFSRAVSLISFEKGLIPSILMNFTTDLSESIIINLFNRDSGIVIKNESIIDSWGNFRVFDYIYNRFEDYGYIFIYRFLIKQFITYSEYFAKFLCFRYLEILEFIDNWTIIANITLSENEFTNEIYDNEMLNFAYDLGYTEFILARKIEFQNGEYNLLVLFRNNNNQSMFFVESRGTAILFNFSLSPTNQTLITVHLNETRGLIFDMSDLTIISSWGEVHHSCNYDRCFAACLTGWLTGPWGLICFGVCFILCEVCIDTIMSPEPFSKALCVGCLVCIGICACAPLISCAIECAVNPCSHGHVCVPGTVRNKHCADFSSGYYHTLIWEECNNIGMAWVTHYDYCGARGLICDPNTLVCRSAGGGGGGGCPILSVYNGTDYVEEGLLDLHNPDSIDIVTIYELYTEPKVVNNRYVLKLTEHPKTISHIDKVQLFGLLSNNLIVPLPLISAIHSAMGQVSQILRYSDNLRVDELGADHNEGTSESINLEFLALPYIYFKEFIFVIEGYNMIIK